jgi:hypothetical protein
MDQYSEKGPRVSMLFLQDAGHFDAGAGTASDGVNNRMNNEPSERLGYPPPLTSHPKRLSGVCGSA